MSIPGAANPLLLRTAAAGGYSISRSLRFNSADSAYLSRTPASAGNRKTWTWAGWVKRSALNADSNDGHLFACTSGASDSTYARLWITNNRFYFSAYSQSWRGSTAYFRDLSAWYHFVCVVDTTQSIGADRIKMYVNGTQITSFAESVDPGQNTDLGINQNTAHRIGAETNIAGYFNGYLADIHFIDGQALDPTSFGEFDDNGIWQPIEYTGSYGTNGFRLDFADNASTTTIGYDAAGSNDWTANNLSITAGAGNDSLVDVPTNGAETDTGVGGEVRGNYCTLNPLNNPNTTTLSNGNLDAVVTNFYSPEGNIAVSSGKWYWEMTITANNSAGQFAVGIKLANNGDPFDPGYASSSYAYYSDGRKRNSSTYSSYGATYAVNNIISVLLDLDAGTVSFSKNGTSQGTAFSSLPAGSYISQIGNNLSSASTTFVANFGQRPFAYTAPSGFKALNTANLPAPVITKPSDVMDVKLYTGNGSSQSITGLGFSPDFVWVKARNASYSHRLWDAVRGATKGLMSDGTDAEFTEANGLTAFNSDGFSIGTGLSESAKTYAAWTWDAGSSTVTNTSGTISSQVRANASAGFSIVTYTGTGANATVGHGLGVAPGMVIVKRRDTSGNWQVRHTSIAAASSIQLNLTNAAASATTVWNSTAPSSTVFSVGTDATVNASGGTYVAYCFAPVAGYSSFGSYTGNGSADGPFIYTGFRPRFVMLKGSSFVSNWHILDAARNAYNVTDSFLRPNLSSQELNGITEGAGSAIDILSNGFKLRASFADSNTNAASFVWAAFAESPFQYARAR